MDFIFHQVYEPEQFEGVVGEEEAIASVGGQMPSS